MSDPMPERGVLYTEYSSLTAQSPCLTSLWSFQSGPGDRRRQRVAVNGDGDHEFWLDRPDPLLNVMLPDTSLSLIVNLADPGAMGSSRAGEVSLPRVCVLGPSTRARPVTPGGTVRAVGVGLDPNLAPELLGVRAANLVDRVMPLAAFWGVSRVHALTASMSRLSLEECALLLHEEVERRLGRARNLRGLERTLTDLIKQERGRISVEELTQQHGVNRQLIARRFRDTVGLSPKLFARITRFQQLVQALLATDVSQWASMATSAGYYDQAHMINEFRNFAGAPPTAFFQRRGTMPGRAARQLRGRPSEWFRSPS